MTIIVASSGVMAADSVVRSGDMLSLVAFPKIVRLPDGRLIGTSGMAVDCYAIQQWFLAGEPEKRPSLIGTAPDHDADILMMKLDGTIWRNGTGVDGFFPQPDPTSIGAHTAALVAEAAIECGQSPKQAIELVIRMLAGFGGPVQVERIQPEMAREA